MDSYRRDGIGPTESAHDFANRSGADVVTLIVDCHAYAWHEVDSEYAECGPDNLVRMAEEFGILVSFLPDHENAGWAWHYMVTGPRDHVVKFLTAEYAGEESLAREMVECAW